MKVLLAHGSSDSVHGEQVRAFTGKVSALLEGEVGVAFLSNGSLPEGALVLPLFLGAGKHVTEDIPNLVKASGCTLLPPVGEHAEAIATIACEQLTRDSKQAHPLFVLYQMEAFEPLANALRACNRTCTIASLHGDSSVTCALNLLHDDGIENVIVQPMLLFGGCSLARVRMMIAESSIPNATLAPLLSECESFATLVADSLRVKP